MKITRVVSGVPRSNNKLDRQHDRAAWSPPTSTTLTTDPPPRYKTLPAVGPALLLVNVVTQKLSLSVNVVREELSLSVNVVREELSHSLSVTDNIVELISHFSLSCDNGDVSRIHLRESRP